MAYLAGLLVLFLSVYSCSSRLIKGDDDDNSTEELTWPVEYYLKGEELNLKTGHVAPFQMWSAQKSEHYRRDYYGGVEKKYFNYDNETSRFLKSYYIFPVSDDEIINEFQCVVMGAEWEEVEFLPDLSGATYKGTEVFEDKDVQVWEMEYAEDSYTNDKAKVKAYTYEYDGYHVPVQITKIVYNMDKGFVKSHTITNYYDFSSELDMTDLDVEWEAVDCETEEMFWLKYPDMNKLNPGQQSHVHLAFRRFVKQHNKPYGKKEHKTRKAIFEKNWKEVVEHNSKNLGYKLSMNKFADWSEEELSVLAATRWGAIDATGATPFPYSDKELEELAQDLPDEVDLHLDGMITPVKDQQNCGSCWAFAATSAVEGALALKNGGRDLDLSEQSLVDCAWGFDSAGCMGGTAYGGLKYILEHGMPTEEEYGPYTAINGLCGVYNMTKLYTITGYGQVVPRNPIAMKLTLNKYGPVVVGVHATTKMMLYESGVFYDISCEPDSANHAVTVVGYGVQDGDLYWMVKNSWGEDWGQDGYILLSANNNNCLLLDTAFYPIA